MGAGSGQGGALEVGSWELCGGHRRGRGQGRAVKPACTLAWPILAGVLLELVSPAQPTTPKALPPPCRHRLKRYLEERCPARPCPVLEEQCPARPCPVLEERCPARPCDHVLPSHALCYVVAVYLLTHLPACLPTCPPACLPAYLWIQCLTKVVKVYLPLSPPLPSPPSRSLPLLPLPPLTTVRKLNLTAAAGVTCALQTSAEETPESSMTVQ